MKKLLLLAALCSCALVQSFNDVRLTSLSNSEYRVEVLAAGLLTVASNAQITSLRGSEVSKCVFVKPQSGGFGLICRRVTSGFKVEFTSIGATSVTARLSK